MPGLATPELAPSTGTGTFRSLRGYNYRVWAAGGIVSNVGTWMQRTAQDWIVLTQLTHHSATAVGVVMALQFGPQLLLLPFTGYAADHLNRRRLLIATQTAMALLALCLGLLTVTGLVRLWQVDVFAFLFGCTAAFDAPARQTFVSELVGETDLPNAVALNSTSFNIARMIGPSVAGLLIATIGVGWVFLINAGSYLAVLGSLALLRGSALHHGRRATRARGGFSEGFRTIAGRPDLQAVLLMLFLVGTFGLNFPIFISTMSVRIFHGGARSYGLLASTMAIGSVAGALLSARRTTPRPDFLIGGTALFGCGFIMAACMPNARLFGLALVVIGIAAQTVTTTAISLVQLSTDPAMRGRVMAIVLAVSLGGTPLGAPLVGWVADVLGPRQALGIGAASGIGAALVGVLYLVRHRGLRLHRPDGWPRLTLSPAAEVPPAGTLNSAGARRL
ncbi:MFS transporter [Lichenicola sp.]|uniref:MFS transporter n=1 Tax=Lichenicola sp. TaxID=2804529 RepID=UPI003B00D6F7